MVKYIQKETTLFLPLNRTTTLTITLLHFQLRIRFSFGIYNTSVDQTYKFTYKEEHTNIA